MLLLYAYHETEQAHSNLLHYLKHGPIPTAQGRQVFVVNGPHSLRPEQFAKDDTIIERENEGFDFGAWAVGLERAPNEAYTHVVLMNASVRGPYLPLYELRPWWRVFGDQLGGESNVGLVGTSLNCWASLSETHLQSMFLMFSYDRLADVIIPRKLLSSKQDHTDAVYRGEIPFSRAFLEAGYALKTQLMAFRAIHGVVTPAAARNEDGGVLYGICRRLLAVWKSTSVSAMTRPSWLGRAVRNRHRHAIEQASRRWRGGGRDDSARTRRKILISTQKRTLRRQHGRDQGADRQDGPDRDEAHHVF